MEQTIERDGQCFCCGADNPRGLHLEFEYPAPGQATAAFLVPDYFAGWKGITHGGFISMLLDEAMAHACIGLAESAVTGEMTVRFKKPVPTGSRVRIEGQVEETKGRILVTRGRIIGEDGVVAAEASARFIRTGVARDATSTAPA